MTRKNLILVSVWIILLLVLGVLIINLHKQPFPQELVTFSNDWPTANQNYSNTRSAVGSTINSTTVSKLGLAWSLPIEGISDWGSAATNPLILGNTVYFQDLKSNVYAVNFQTGVKTWIKKYNLDSEGPTGVAVGYNKVYAAKGHFEVVALDLQGNEVWTTNLSKNQNVGVDIQPVVYNNLVYVSTVPGVSNLNFYKGGSVGVLYALDAGTGMTKWSFDTVDTANIWGDSSVNSGGGAWYPPAIDSNSGSIYWGIGNPGPWPGTPQFPNGSSRPGANLYTSSLLSLDGGTGKLNWFFQARPHDLFDYDLEASPILATLPINNKPTDIVIAAGKMGRVYALDRKTGNKIWETPVGTHLNDDLTALPAGFTSVSPSPLGGVETNMAYSNGLVFVPVVNMTVRYSPSAIDQTSFNLSKGTGELVALDAATGKILWDNKLNSVNVGAATVVNDLVFTATYDGKIYAFRLKDGQQIWSYQAPGGINGWPAVKGDTIIFPVGLGKTPQLLALKIGGQSLQPGSSLPAGGPGKEFQQ